MAGEKRPMSASPDASPPRQIVLALAAPGQFGTPIRPPAPGQAAAAAAPAVVAAAAAAPERGSQEEQQEKMAEFKQKHAEFRAEAAGLAAEFGVDVNAFIFAPGGTHAFHDVFPGDTAGAAQRKAAAEESEARKEMVDLLRKDVKQIAGLEEAKAHEAQLLELRAALQLRLQEIRAAAAASTSAANGPAETRREE